MTVNVRALFREAVREVIGSGLEFTNDLIVKRVMQSIPDKELRSACEQLAHSQCSAFVGEFRRQADHEAQRPQPAPEASTEASGPATARPRRNPQPSARLENVRRHSDRCRKLLEQPLNIGQGLWKPRGECTPEEVLYSVNTRYVQAAGLRRTAEEDERRANKAIALGLPRIADLDEEDLLFSDAA